MQFMYSWLLTEIFLVTWCLMVQEVVINGWSFLFITVLIYQIPHEMFPSAWPPVFSNS